jgi:hypothetical protein
MRPYESRKAVSSRWEALSWLFLFFPPDTEVKDFARREFGRADLGDVRLNKRLLLIAERIALDPAWSIPQVTDNAAEAKGAYRFFSNKAVTREGVLESHIQATVDRVKQEPEILVSADTTFLNFTHHPSTRGLGPIGSKSAPNKLKGVLVHSSLAVTVEDHRVLGVLAQQVLVREGYQASGESTRARSKRERESDKWMEGARKVIDGVGVSDKLIFVFDREGDIFEVFEELQDHGARFVIRAARDRRIETGSEEKQYLFASIRSEPVMAHTTITIPAGGGRKERKARLAIRTSTYNLLPPKKRDRAGIPRPLNVVHVLEEQPPEGSEPMEWTLFTGEPVATSQEALRVVNHYCGRWKIEEWHKGIKTGCRIEERQLETWERLDVLLGIFSVMAWRLLSLRDAARKEQPLKVEQNLTDLQVTMLQAKFQDLKEKKDAQSYLVAIAKLGGFLARKGDGHPGWITLWRGFSRLHAMEDGFRLGMSYG